IMELTKIPFDSVTMTVLIAMMVNGGICYAFSTFLEKNPTDAERIVKDWIVSTFIINFIFVGSIAAYIGAYIR
ncbi:MAG TPA: hypothetical protein VKK79_17605, partial [Candidatus Lokiarchaeia archaeon]|nr:hypothetical protein [Candidatus Lokiarchaeia archaeon]